MVLKHKNDSFIVKGVYTHLNYSLCILEIFNLTAKYYIANFFELIKCYCSAMQTGRMTLHFTVLFFDISIKSVSRKLFVLIAIERNFAPLARSFVDAFRLSLHYFVQNDLLL